MKINLIVKFDFNFLRKISDHKNSPKTKQMKLKIRSGIARASAMRPGAWQESNPIWPNVTSPTCVSLLLPFISLSIRSFLLFVTREKKRKIIMGCWNNGGNGSNCIHKSRPKEIDISCWKYVWLVRMEILEFLAKYPNNNLYCWI